MNRELLEKPFTPDQIKQRERKRCHILNCEFNNKYYNHKS